MGLFARLYRLPDFQFSMRKLSLSSKYNFCRHCTLNLSVKGSSWGKKSSTSYRPLKDRIAFCRTSPIYKSKNTITCREGSNPEWPLKTDDSLPLKWPSLTSLNSSIYLPVMLILADSQKIAYLTQSIVNATMVARKYFFYRLKQSTWIISPYHVNSRQCTSKTYHSESMCCKEVGRRCIIS